ncbi:MAG TPA: hypothetical protein VEH29_00260 [Acidimicrobiales bacterium]|nr:hypothetical protein [Acidimicrobiales bacterium]
MGDIPVDAQRVVDKLRAARREAAAAAPKHWVPPDSFGQALMNLPRTPVHVNPDLNWMHHNWDLRELLAPPRRRGLRGAIHWAAHRVVMVVLGPYLDRLQHYLGVNVRAVDAVTRRVDDDRVAQLSLIEAVRADVIDLAYHVDERANG